MKKPWDAGRLFLWVVIIFSVAYVIFLLVIYGMVYETENVADYGKIKGNFDNESPKKFIFSFFPETLNDSFSDITYHYKAIRGDAYAYECYLEFVVEDPDAYRAFLDSYVDNKQTKAFSYDEAYMEYSISNILDIDSSKTGDHGGYPIHQAEIGKILYNDSEQRILFFAMGEYDGGGTETTALDYFFEEFGIDVAEYQLDAYYNHREQEMGITVREREEFDLDGLYQFPK